MVLNQKLCDCFLEYGEVTLEVLMLLAFVLFGIALSGIIDTIRLGPALVLAGLVVFAIRPSILGLVLARSRMSGAARALISWFGPRGLNSLLLALLAVQAEVVGAELLLAVVGVVVIASVAIHGATATPFISWYGRRVDTETLPEERENTSAGLFSHGEGDIPRVTPLELDRLLSEPIPPIVLDVRSRSGRHDDDGQIPGSLRVLPDSVIEWARSNPTDRMIVAYCT